MHHAESQGISRSRSCCWLGVVIVAMMAFVLAATSGCSSSDKVLLFAVKSLWVYITELAAVGARAVTQCSQKTACCNCCHRNETALLICAQHCYFA